MKELHHILGRNAQIASVTYFDSKSDTKVFHAVRLTNVEGEDKTVVYSSSMCLLLMSCAGTRENVRIVSDVKHIHSMHYAIYILLK